MILAQLAHFASHTVNSLAFFQEEQTVSFSPLGLWQHMGWLARTVAIILFIESIWSLAVMIDRYLYFSAARKQSREFAPKVAGALKDGKLEEAIKIADRNKKSHLAEVVTAGLQEFRASGGAATEEHHRELGARTGARRSHRSRQAEEGPRRFWPPSVRRLRSSDCSAPSSAF